VQVGDASATLTSPIFEDGFLAGDPHYHLARLRAEAPVALDVGQRVWVLSGYAEVLAASRDVETFSSRRGILLSEIGVDYPAPPTMMHTDPPQHTRFRRLVEPAFTPEAVAVWEPRLRSGAEYLLDQLPTDEVVDVVSQLAAPYPLRVLADLLGVPERDLPRLREWAEAAVPGVSELPQERMTELMVQMMAYFLSLASTRRAQSDERPHHDVVSHLTSVEVDGDRLNDTELTVFMVQLLVGGNEPARNALAGALVAFAEHPDQWQRLRTHTHLLDSAVEEVLRWTTPVVYYLRTTTRPMRLSGRAIPMGSPVMLLYLSANRDERVFGPTAGMFDIERQPNEHLAFGTGPHVCLGADLARLELRVMFEALLARVEAIELAGTPERSPSLAKPGLLSAPLRLKWAART
jgi:cytochrome P450